MRGRGDVQDVRVDRADSVVRVFGPLPAIARAAPKNPEADTGEGLKGTLPPVQAGPDLGRYHFDASVHSVPSAQNPPASDSGSAGLCCAAQLLATVLEIVFQHLHIDSGCGQALVDHSSLAVATAQAEREGSAQPARAPPLRATRES